jgi:hypothetical protein
MSKIVIYRESLEKGVSKVTDNSNNEKEIEFNVLSYDPVEGTHAFAHVDYLGNMYLKHNDTYYIISLDNDLNEGVSLTPIAKPEVFKNNYSESKFLKNDIRSGTIRANVQTLKGRVQDTITDMTEEERDDYELQYDDNNRPEKKFYRVQYESDDEMMEEEIDDGFYLNGVVDIEGAADSDSKGILMSDMLAFDIGSFDVVLIHGDMRSKNVVSSIEKKNGFSPSTLAIYSSGHFVARFVDQTKIGRLCLSDTNELIMKRQT